MLDTIYILRYIKQSASLTFGEYLFFIKLTNPQINIYLTLIYPVIHRRWNFAVNLVLTRITAYIYSKIISYIWCQQQISSILWTHKFCTENRPEAKGVSEIPILSTRLICILKVKNACLSFWLIGQMR